MTVEVKHEVVDLTYEGGTTGPPRTEAWWAECSDCDKRSKLFLVGLVSAPAMEAEIERESHDCNPAEHFSTTEQVWANFWQALSHPEHLRQIAAARTPALAEGDPESPISKTGGDRD